MAHCRKREADSSDRGRSLNSGSRVGIPPSQAADPATLSMSLWNTLDSALGDRLEHELLRV